MSNYNTSATNDLVQMAYDRLIYWPLRDQMIFDQVASVRPARQTMPGSSVRFTFAVDMAVASTPLDESTDVTPSTFDTTQTDVTLREYGNTAVTTAWLRNTAFVEVDPMVANVVGHNAGVSMDTVARDVLKAGTNVVYSGNATARNTVGPDDTLNSATIREVVAYLRASNVPDFAGYYNGYIHPYAAVDLKEETGEAAWITPANTANEGSRRWRGLLGYYEGVRWIETPRAPLFQDAGSSTTLTDVYRTMIMGDQVLAKVFSTREGNGAQPRIVFGPVTDYLRRFVPVGWYWLGGYAIFRQSNLYGIEHSSRLGDNS